VHSSSLERYSLEPTRRRGARRRRVGGGGNRNVFSLRTEVTKCAPSQPRPVKRGVCNAAENTVMRAIPRFKTHIRDLRAQVSRRRREGVVAGCNQSALILKAAHARAPDDSICNHETRRRSHLVRQGNQTKQATHTYQRKHSSAHDERRLKLRTQKKKNTQNAEETCRRSVQRRA
jgi:hypothetical protein